MNDNFTIQLNDSAGSTINSSSTEKGSIVVQLVIGIFLGVNIVVGVAGNLMVLAAVTKENKLHSRANYLIASLAVTDLLVSLMVLPYAAAITFLGGSNDVWWVSHHVACRLFIFLDVTCCTASILHLCVIAWVRYKKVSTVRLRLYPRNFVSVIPTILCIWFAAILLSVTPFFMFPSEKQSNQHVNISYHKLDSNFSPKIEEENDADERCIVNDNKIYRVVATTVAFYAPLTVIILIYIKMASIAWSTLRGKRFQGYKAVAGRNSLSSAEISNVLDRSEHRSTCFVGCQALSKHYFTSKFRHLMKPKHQHNSPPEDSNCNCSSPDQLNNNQNSFKFNNNVMNSASLGMGQCVNNYWTTEINSKNGASLTAKIYAGVTPGKNNEQDMNIQKAFTTTNEIKPHRSQTEKPIDSCKDNNSHEDAEASGYIDSSSSRVAKPNRIKMSFQSSSKPIHDNNHTPNNRNSLTVPIDNIVLSDISCSNTLSNSEAVVYRRSQIIPPMLSQTLVQDGETRIHKSASIDQQAGCKPRLMAFSQRISSRVNMKRERKIIRTLGIVIGAFVVCWLPFFAKEIILPFCSICYLPPAAEIFINWLGYFNSVLNPIIYARANKDFNRAFRRLFSGKGSTEVRRALSTSNAVN
ncbi:5-hydroxytryptamine receptor 1A-beta-like isoform X1 [Styela clava]